MKTDELIRMLSTNVEPVRRYAVEKKIGQALLAGTLISLLLLIAISGNGALCFGIINTGVGIAEWGTAAPDHATVIN